MATRATETIEEPVISTEEKVTVVVPKDPFNKSSKNLFVSVNEKTYSIPRGVKVEVPLSVALILNDAEILKEEAEKFIEKTSSK